MDNKKKSIHNSGPLGMLVKTGMIKSIDNERESDVATKQTGNNNGIGAYFRTQSGIEFNENELMLIDPSQCEPWKYANRLDTDMGNLEELAKSILDNKQLQPALIRTHQNPHGNIKYEVIFGRRRHAACLKLGLQFLVIKKDIPNIQEAISFQEAENRARKDVSNYSNAMLYKKLLEDRIFLDERELSEKLGMSLSKLYDIMAYSKIPEDIIQALPDIHKLSNNMAIKIVALIKSFPEEKSRIKNMAPAIGVTITSPGMLERNLRSAQSEKEAPVKRTAKTYKSLDGRKLFTFKINHRGSPCLEINSKLNSLIDYEDICEYMKNYLGKI
jgi:ParB family chromosome partitioning protein